MKFYKVPAALQLHEWDEFWEQTKKDYPVQYFFRHVLPLATKKYTSWPLNRYMWKILHRVHPKHRYHVLKPRTLKPGYHDPDRRIMHAMFHEVCEFAENRLMGDGLGGTKWSQDSIDEYDNREEWSDPTIAQAMKQHLIEQIEREQQIIELRNWWVIDRKNREQAEELLWDHLGDIEVPEEWGDHWVLNNEYADTPQSEEYRKRSDHLHEVQEQWKEEDRRKLHEVVDLLPHLWY